MTALGGKKVWKNRKTILRTGRALLRIFAVKTFEGMLLDRLTNDKYSE